jgi:ubiquinone/menaquinone biosynthesis C-methylase UbiE
MKSAPSFIDLTSDRSRGGGTARSERLRHKREQSSVEGACMAELNSNAEWKQWGKDDPLWAVASWDGKQRGGASPWTDEEFYALGESDWRDFMSHWQHYGVSTESCLEIGCGAGRLTKQLALHFDHVYAVDVSPEMIDRAQKAIERGSVEFSVIDGLHLPQGDGSVKAVFSAHVLQHLDNTDVGFMYFRKFYRVLGAGGTIMVHIPLYQFPIDTGLAGALMSSPYAVRRFLSNISAGAKRRLGKKTMRFTRYPIDTLRAYLSNCGFKRVEFRIFPVKSNGGYHTFVFATK